MISLGALIANVAISWMIGIIAKDQQEIAAQRKFDDAQNRNDGILLNTRSTVAPLDVIYGERATGGNLVFAATSGTDNQYLYMVIALCEGEVESIGDIYINDIIATDDRYSGLVTINKHLGGDDQMVDDMLFNAGIGWTQNHRGRGIAYLACQFKWDREVFSSWPTVYAVVKGRKVYDPRTQTTAYSQNPVLCLRDYLTNSRYGKALDTAVIDDDAIITAANLCDKQVILYSGASADSLFTCNAVIDTSASLMDNTRVLLSGMRGHLPYQQGFYSLAIEDEQAAGYTPFAFDESNIIAGTLALQSNNKAGLCNQCIATYTDPDSQWQANQVIWPAPDSVQMQTYLAQDGQILTQRISLETITDPYRAEDIAEIFVRRTRDSLMVQLKAFAEAMQCTVGDIVTISHSTPGWDAKPFRILHVQLSADGNVGIEAVEHQDSIYPWSSKPERDNIPNTNLPDTYYVLAPTPVSVLEELYFTTKSKGVQARAIFTWAVPNDAFVDQYEARFKLSGDSDWTYITRTSVTSARVDDLAPGTYDFAVRSINSAGRTSNYAILPNQVFAGKTAPPENITGFSLRALDGNAHLSWDPISDLDVTNGGFVRIRHSRQKTGATWGDGQDIGKQQAGNQTNAILPLLAGTYMAKAVDSTGNFSLDAVYAITTVPNILNFNVVETADETTSYTGTKNNMIVSSGLLQLSTNDGQIVNNGEYYFSAPIDLGYVMTSRVSSDIETSTTAINDTIDSRLVPIDSWGLFDGTPSDDITAELQIRTTNDDPNNSPNWSDWTPFLVADYQARAFDFRLVITNLNPVYQIYVSKLAVTVDMPDRIETGRDITPPPSGLDIVFNHAFYAPPSIGITMQNGDYNDSFELTNVTATGFKIQTFFGTSSTGSSIKTINYQAVGYGKVA